MSGFRDKPWVNPDPPHIQAQVGVGMANLKAWVAICPHGYTGPWPSAYQLQDDTAYALWLKREDVVAALATHPRRSTSKPRPKAEEPPIPAAAPDGPTYEHEEEFA